MDRLSIEGHERESGEPDILVLTPAQQVARDLADLDDRIDRAALELCRRAGVPRRILDRPLEHNRAAAGIDRLLDDLR